MDSNSKSGSGSASAFFVILFLASVALNAAFMTGCVSLDDFQGGRKGPRPSESGPSNPSSSEAVFLRDIATSLGLSPSSDKTPGDIALDIKQTLGDSQKYRGEVLSDPSFEECKAAMPTSKDADTFEQYHRFIRKVEGKRIVILDN